MVNRIAPPEHRGETLSSLLRRRLPRPVDPGDRRRDRLGARRASSTRRSCARSRSRRCSAALPFRLPLADARACATPSSRALVPSSSNATSSSKHQNQFSPGSRERMIGWPGGVVVRGRVLVRRVVAAADLAAGHALAQVHPPAAGAQALGAALGARGRDVRGRSCPGACSRRHVSPVVDVADREQVGETVVRRVGGGQRRPPARVDRAERLGIGVRAGRRAPRRRCGRRPGRAGRRRRRRRPRAGCRTRAASRRASRGSRGRCRPGRAARRRCGARPPRPTAARSPGRAAGRARRASGRPRRRRRP